MTLWDSQVHYKNEMLLCVSTPFEKRKYKVLPDLRGKRVKAVLTN